MDYLDKCYTITGAYYADLLRQRIKRIRRGKLRRGVFLHQDNAQAHMSTVVRAEIQKCGFHLVEHSPYPSDLAPSDYLLLLPSTERNKENTSLVIILPEMMAL